MDALNEQEFEYLQKWWDQVLPEEESRTLARRYQEDETFRRSADEYRKIFEGLRSIKRDELRARLKAIPTSQLYVEQAVSTIRPWYRMAAAVLLIGILCSVVYFVLRPKTEGTSDLQTKQNEQESLVEYSALALTKNFQAPDWLPASMGADQEALLKEAGIAYVDSEFSKVIALLQQYLVLDPENNEVIQMLIVAYLKRGEGSRATPYITQLESNFELAGSDTLLWYKALAKVQENKNQEAIELLNKLTAEESAYQKEAIKILTALKKGQE
jgi:hypothetical protein